MFRIIAGSWRGGGSGMMKEDALNLAKMRVSKLERQVRDEIDAKKKLTCQVQDLFKGASKWKSAFMEVSDRATKAACTECQPKVQKLAVAINPSSTPDTPAGRVPGTAAVARQQ